MPLVLATGAGAEMRQSLGTAVFSGMIGVTLFGIFLTPVFFFGLSWFGRQSQPQAQPAADKIGSAASPAQGDGDGKVASSTPEAHPLPPT